MVEEGEGEEDDDDEEEEIIVHVVGLEGGVGDRLLR